MLFIFIIKVLFSYFFCFGNFLQWCLLSFLDYAMCGNNQSLFLSIPKGEMPVAYTIVESSKLPDLGILQFLENVNFHHSFLNLEDVVVYLLLSFEWLRIQNACASSVNTTFSLLMPILF